MQIENDLPTPPRSKLEFLYRDLLIECHKVSQRQEALAKQVDDASIRMENLTSHFRQATHHATQQASARIQTAAEGVSTSLNEANQRLLAAQKHQNNLSHHNLMVVAAIAAGASLLGGLLGALITVLVLI
ncbi:MAG: hypothetical protein CML16_05470 [Pusillimonas sp.]|nr:hypothetical protein [Pusillimonas sp.]HCP78708.1 hypothetical protein [Pusillimonas sp.]|tara:strand:+ start:1236 stop:1625 length:390 start_codon:yes stop_codon:yes gene_type:complete